MQGSRIHPSLNLHLTAHGLASPLVMRLSHFFFISSITFILTGCDSGPRLPPSPASDHAEIKLKQNPHDAEADVMKAFLYHEYAYHLKSGKMVTISPRASIEVMKDGFKTDEDFANSLIGDARDKDLRGAIYDFVNRNKIESHIPVISSKSITILDETSTRRLFDDNDDLNKAWEAFYKQNPKSVGIVRISRVGMNRAGNVAIIYHSVQYASLGGHDEIHVLRKVDGKWKIERLPQSPQWIS